MSKLNTYLCIIFCFIGLNHAFSQQIDGSIKNTKGEYLPYASIYLMNSKIGTTSNENGKFILKTTQQLKLDTLVVSYIGYEKYKLPIYINNTNNSVSIILKNTSTNLSEFIVESLPFYPPEEIIKKVIKNVKKNYNRENILSNGFYRELVKEDDNWIVLNEAAIQLKYAPYPQKGFLHQAFKAYYDYDNLPWNERPQSVFRNMHRFLSFIPIDNDQINIVSSRTSNNNTKYGIEASPVGGVGDLIALDKIKYFYDFLDPKLIDKYHYKQFGEEYLENAHCYVIDFYPKKIYETQVRQGLNEKMQFPIYVGRIYIEAKTFAVVNIQYQLSIRADFSNYQDWEFPNFLRVNVDYKKYNNRWILSSVDTEQKKDLKIGNRTVSYTCLRLLQLQEPKIKKIEFNSDSVAFITKSTQLRYFYNKYNEQFWKKYQLSSAYPKLPKNVQLDLEETTPLSKQFLSLNLPIDSIQPPIARQETYKHIYFLDTLQDNYNWISQKDNKDVINYLNTENNYYNNVLFKLNDSIKGFYYRYNNIFKHFTDTIKTVNYFTLNDIKCRYKQAESGNTGLYYLLNDSTEKLLLDITKISEGKPNFWIESMQLNNEAQLAYTYSQKGNITNTLVVTNLEYEIPNVYSFLWLNDTTILYTKTDSTQRSSTLWTFNLNNKATQLIYEEKNKTFDVSIKNSTSEKYIFIVVESHNEREFYYIDKNTSNIELLPIVKRLQNHNYTIDHQKGNSFYGITNRNKGYYEVVEIPIQNPSLNNWKTIYTTSNPIEDFYITKDFIAIQEYNKTTLELKYIYKATKKVNDIKLNDEIFSFYFNKSKSDTSNTIQIDYESPKTAYITYNIDLETENKKIIEQEEFTFDKETYNIEVLSAISNDNVKIPITLFYDKALIKDSIKGIILKSYGAYGAKYYPEFNSEDKVYVDLGFIVAFAHVRGGGELGDDWYKQGKLLNKKNTFEDYVVCAKFLTDKYKIQPKQLTGYGLSAGGLIMGYVANNYPQLFGTLIFDRPYLDVLNTMMDSTLALTTMEYDEWGNPNDSTYYNYIKSYSPYQNITKQHYPNMLFFSGYHDEQTPYWQIAKSVAKYRANNISNSIILLNTDLLGGHRGSTNSTKNTNKLAAKFSLINYTLRTGK